MKIQNSWNIRNIVISIIYSTQNISADWSKYFWLFVSYLPYLQQLDIWNCKIDICEFFKYWTNYSKFKIPKTFVISTIYSTPYLLKWFYWFVIVTWLSILCGLVRQDFRHSLTLEFLFRSLLVTLRFLLWRNITESYKHVTIGSYVQLKTINEGDGNYLGFFNQLGFEMYLTTWKTQKWQSHKS